MKVTRGEGEPLILIITDNSPGVDVVIKRFLDSIELKKGRMEVFPYKEAQKEKILSLAKEAAAVVDFQTCPLQTSTEGIHVVESWDQTDFDLKTRKLTQIIKPHFIIRELVSDATSNLHKELVAQHIPCTGFRISPMDQLNEYTLGHVFEGLKQFLQFHEMLEGGFLLRTLATFKREAVHASRSGMFETKHIVLETPPENDQLFKITDKDGGMHMAEAEAKKKILELHEPGFVKKGELIMTLGESIPF